MKHIFFKFSRWHVCSFPTFLSLSCRELETEQRKKLSELKERFAAESKQWQEQTKTMRDQFQNKMNYLIKLWVHVQKHVLHVYDSAEYYS